MTFHEKIISSIPYRSFVKLRNLFDEYSFKDSSEGVTPDKFQEMLNQVVPSTFNEKEILSIFEKCDCFEMGRISWNDFSSVCIFFL
jgi:Ca2+-binding EF-hand superfamily protein